MAVIAFILLLLSCSIAGQATPTSSPAPRPAARSTGIRGTAERDEMLVKRTSGSSSHRRRRWSPHLQGSVLQQEPPIRNSPGAPPAPQPVVGNRADWPPLSRPAPPHIPAGELSAAPTEVHEPYSMLHRRPYRSLKENPDAKLAANRESQARTMARLKSGYRTIRPKLGASKYAVTTYGEHLARRRENSRRLKSNLTEEEKKKRNEKRNESARLYRAKKKAQREAQLEGGSGQGTSVRKSGEPLQSGEQEQARAAQVRSHTSSDTRIEEAMQHSVGAPHAPPTTVWQRPPGSASGFASVLDPLHGALRQRFGPGTSSSQHDLDLSLSAPGPTTIRQKQTTHARPAARKQEEDRLGLTLAPPGEHDRLRLTIGPPGHE